MRVLLLANLASGKGRAGRLADRFALALGAAGIGCEVRDARGGAADGASRARRFEGFDAVAAVGGDGTLHHMLDDACEAVVPVYHVPAGNENLFAREFGMTAEPDRLVRALERGVVSEVDVGVVGGRSFAVMVSVGPDAGVVHRLDGVRGRATGHAMYAGPVLREIWRPRIAHLSVYVDGSELVGQRRGMVVVANSRQYAARLDPARSAEMDDGLLDVVFFPASTTSGMLAWGAACLVGDPRERGGVRSGRGREIVVRGVSTAPVQADGEAAGWLPAGGVARFGVRRGALRVLRPIV